MLYLFHTVPRTALHRPPPQGDGRAGEPGAGAGGREPGAAGWHHRRHAPAAAVGAATLAGVTAEVVGVAARVLLCGRAGGRAGGWLWAVGCGLVAEEKGGSHGRWLAVDYQNHLHPPSAELVSSLHQGQEPYAGAGASPAGKHRALRARRIGADSLVGFCFPHAALLAAGK